MSEKIIPQKYEDLFERITEIFNDGKTNSLDEVRVLSMVTSYVLCNHVPTEDEAYEMLNKFTLAVSETMKSANNAGHTIWVEGRGH